MQQPAPQSAPLGEQYNFIMNPAKPHKPALIAGGSALKRGGIIAGGLAILVILAIVVASIFSSGKNTAKVFIPVMQQQTELIRITTAAGLVTTQQNTQALTNAVNLSLTSAQQQLATYLSQNHQKIKPATLALAHNKTADTQLTNAQANDTYDSTLNGILQNDLNSYSQALKTAYAANPGPKGRQLLSKQYDAAQLLLKQAKQ